MTSTRPLPRLARVVLGALAVLAAHAAVLTPGASAASTCATKGVSVAPLQSNVFYIDADQGYLGSYVGYRIGSTTATPQKGLWLRLESFTGGVVASADGQSTTAPLPLSDISGLGNTPGYAYLKAGAETTVAQRHDVVLYQGRPGAGGVEVCRETQTIARVDDVIKAAANKVTGATVSTTSATLGGAFELTVTGDTGTLGQGPAYDPSIIRFSPAVAAAWPSSAFRLVSVVNRFPATGPGVADVLSRNDVLNEGLYSITYRFRVVGPTASPAAITPVQNIASGTQVKHTDPGTLASLAPIPVVTSTTSISVKVPAGPFAQGDEVPLQVTVTNSGAGAVELDELLVGLPTGWGYKLASSGRDGSALGDPYFADGELHYVGPHAIAGNTTTTFDLTALAGAAGSSGSITASGILAGGRIDSTNAPGDDAPASAPVQVMAAPDAVDDTATATVGAARLLDVTANDALSGATPTVTITSAPQHGTATVQGTKISYTATEAGSDALTYRVTTPAGTDTAVVDLTVSPRPPAPTPADRSSSGTGTAPQEATVAVPADGSVAFVGAGDAPVASLTRSGVGTFAVHATTGVITFTPSLGYSGTTDPVTFEVADAYGGTGRAAYTATVAKPAGPTAADKASSGTGTAAQTATLAIPASGSATLLDAEGEPATAVTVDGAGRFAYAAGEITFTPAAGYAASTATVDYRVTDAYGQHATATYTPAVAKPAAPDAPARTSTGAGPEVQDATLPRPDGGTVRLLDAAGDPVTSVTVAGKGTYELDPQTGRVTFTPVAGYAGTPPAVAYRVTDAYGQSTDSTYAPTVTAPAAPVVAPATTTGVGVAVQSRTISVPAGSTVRLLDGAAAPTLRVDQAGKGVYTLEPSTSEVSFTPVLGFSGAAPACSTA
jgi:CshA-type fibril repeat protein